MCTHLHAHAEHKHEDARIHLHTPIRTPVTHTREGSRRRRIHIRPPDPAPTKALTLKPHPAPTKALTLKPDQAPTKALTTHGRTKHPPRHSPRTGELSPVSGAFSKHRRLRSWRALSGCASQISCGALGKPSACTLPLRRRLHGERASVSNSGVRKVSSPKQQ